LRLSIKYTSVKVGEGCIDRPMIPLIIRRDEKHIPLLGILDSGSDFMLVPKDIAEYLNLELHGSEEADAIGSKVETKKSTVSLTVSDGKTNVYLQNIPVRVLMQDGLKEVIVGRIPFFGEFDITFRENSKRIELVRTKRG